MGDILDNLQKARIGKPYGLDVQIRKVRMKNEIY